MSSYAYLGMPLTFAHFVLAFGIITAFNAWYVGLAGLLTPETSFFMLPIGEHLARPS